MQALRVYRRLAQVVVHSPEGHEMNARDELAQIIMSPESFDGGPVSCGPNSVYAARTADAILAAGYRKVEPAWSEGLVNDGSYEYTVSSDCDGSNVKHWRRRPGLNYEGQATPWESYEPAATK